MNVDMSDWVLDRDVTGHNCLVMRAEITGSTRMVISLLTHTNVNHYIPLLEIIPLQIQI